MLCGEIHGTDTCSVIRKNGKIIDKFQWRNGGILLVHNGKVRVYGKFQPNTNIYEYKPNYWENGNFYDVELEAPTLLAMTLFAQPQKFYIKMVTFIALVFFVPLMVIPLAFGKTIN